MSEQSGRFLQTFVAFSEHLNFNIGRNFKYLFSQEENNRVYAIAS